MDNLLFTALIIALLYYFFYYLPNQEKVNQPISISRSVQTDSFSDEKAQEIINLKNKNQQLETELKTKIKEKDNEIKRIQNEARELAKRPLKPTNSKGIQVNDQELENTLDNLIKNIQTLNNSLE